MIAGVIFDLGGTLAALVAPQETGSLDRRNAVALLDWLRQHGAHVDDGFADAVVAERAACVAKRTSRLQEITAAEALRPVLQRYGLRHDEASVASAEAAFFAPELALMRPLPDATEVLQGVRDLRLRAGVVSNASSHYFVVACCRKLGFARFLDPIVSSAQVGWAKPDPRVFAPVLKRWSLSPAQLVMVGDTLSADIAGAHQMGMRSILLAPTPVSIPSDDVDARPDAVALGLAEVRQLLEQWTVKAGR